jgi:HSP20 family molecular chaperone IbpA
MRQAADGFPSHSEVKASLDNGVLSVEIGKRPAKSSTQRRQIKIA